MISFGASCEILRATVGLDPQVDESDSLAVSSLSTCAKSEFQIKKFGQKCSSLYIKTLKSNVCADLGYINIQTKIGTDLKKICD